MEIQDLYPLSPLQQGMLFHDLYAPESGMYVERLRYTIRGDLNVVAFEQAWRQVVERHAVLRSAFIWEEVDEPLQAVFREVETPLEFQDWRGAPVAEQEEQLQAHLAEILQRGFKLSRPPLQRLTLIQMSERVSEFIWSYHHLLLDGWSVSVILGEIITLYEAFCQGQKPQLEKSRPYRDYIAWLKRQDQAEAEAFWRKALKGFIPLASLSMNGTHDNLAGRQEDYESLQMRLSKETAERLDAFARQHRLTVNTVAQAAWALLLSCYSGEQDVVFGEVVSGRPADLAGSESMVGMFINTLPVRARVSPESSVLSWLERLQARQIEARRYEYNPLVKVREWSEAPRGLPLLESIVVFENPTMGIRLGRQEGSPEISYATHYATVTGYPLTVVIEPGPEGVLVGFTYDRRRFKSDAIHRMQLRFQTFLEGVLADPERRLSDLPLLTEAERRELLVDWNSTAKDFSEDRRLHRLFEAQVERTPNAIAVVFEEKKLTYRELNARANRLAHYLRAQGVGPERLVGICLDRSLEMMVAILGVLKAGGAYVPLDPAYPKERLAFMLEDSQASVLLTQGLRIADCGLRIADETAQSAIPDSQSPIPDPQSAIRNPVVICLDAIEERLAGESAENLANGATAEAAAYVIYTSGSTGRPKGVIVSHRAVSNHMLWLRDYFGLNATDRFLQKTQFSFDAAGTEFFAPLLVGARLIMARPGGHQDGAYLSGMITEHGVTILQLVPSLLRALLDEPEFAECRSLRRIICAGEALPAELQDQFRACLDAELHNFYGPTEAAIDVTYWPHQHAAGGAIVPIGRPIANTQIYLLSGDLRPVPVGAPGELYIGGDNLARGYLKRPELTVERFIPNPFGSGPGARLYKTGDLARYMPDGNIEFLGRIDHQVKVRGFRIELGEIESALNQHPAVRESVVIAQDDKHGNKRLAAYVVTDPAASLSELSSKELREFIKTKLPEYMAPSAFVLLDALPLTPNGKVDRRALPALNGSQHDSHDSSEVARAPRNRVEEILAGVWSQVLGVKQVGIDEDFFEMGGDSILSIQVVGKANQQGLRLTPRQIFQHPTIAELATVVDTAVTIHSEQGLVTGQVPLTPIQHWFFERNLPEPHYWNHAILLDVRQALDASLLEQAVGQLLAHHDALRLRFERHESGWRQNNAGWDEEDRSSIPFARFDLSDVPERERSAAIEAKAAELQESLNLSQGPLMRVALFDLGPRQSSRLLILIHHLAVDGVAWRILLEDLMTAYQQVRRGENAQLPPKTTSFRDWAQKLAAYARTAELIQELGYWLAPARVRTPRLPMDYPDGHGVNTEASARVMSVSLTVEETQALLQEAPKAYRTQINDLLLTALAQSFSQWTESRTLLVDLEGHGREAIFDEVDLSRTVGWFTTIFPALLNLEAWEPGEALKSIKEQLRAIPNRGVGYGLLRYLSGDKEIAAQLRQLPQAEVSFNYLGQFDQLLPEGAPLGPATESVGPAHSPRGSRCYPLEINAFISGGRLQLEWTYSERIHRHETIEYLAQNYSSALRALIAHCLSTEAGGYTPSDFPLANLKQSKLDWLTGADREIEDIYPLAPMQEALLFYTLLTPESGAYFTQQIYELEGLNVEAMKRAWRRVSDRHPILRTAFAWKNLDNPLQIVRRRVDFLVEEEDWRGLSPGERKERLENFLKTDQKRGFHISQAPLMRVALFQVTDNTYQLVWSYHHLLLDGWSATLLIKEVLSFYESFDKGQDLQLERSRPYRDYIEWLGRQDLSGAEAFWKRFLKGFTSSTPLGPPGTGKALKEGGYAEHEVRLDEALTAAIHSFARKRQLTLNTLSQAVWSLMLSHQSGSKDVVFGATLSGRPVGLSGAGEMIGLFINTLPVRARIKPDMSLTQWLKELQEQQAEILQYEGSPLNEVQRWSEVPQDKPLFESIVVFENFPMAGAHTFQGNGLRFVNTDYISRTNFPLTLGVVAGSRLLLKILYDAGRFDADTIVGTLAQLETLLRNIVAQPEVSLAELMETLAEAARRRRSVKEEEFKATRRRKLQDVKRKAVDDVEPGSGGSP